MKIQKDECKVVEGDIVCNKKNEKGEYELIKVDLNTLVQTNKKKSLSYIVLYIMGLILFLIFAVLKVVGEEYIDIANYIFIAGVASTLVATIIWGLDRTKAFRS